MKISKSVRLLIVCTLLIAASAFLSTSSRDAGAAPACKDFYFIAARGSGEPFSTSTTLDGSPETRTVLDGITNYYASEGKLPVYQTINIDYPARPVPPMLLSLANAAAAPSIASIALAQRVVADYLKGERQAETQFSQNVDKIVKVCPTAHIVLAGFSQGAMALHNYLIKLGKRANISGAVLIADPERLPNSQVINYGTAAQAASVVKPTRSDPRSFGVCALLENLPKYGRPSCLAGYKKIAEVPPALREVTSQICMTSDSVCSTGESTVPRDPVGNLRRLTVGTFNTHLNCASYCGDEVHQAGQVVAQRIIGQSTTKPEDPRSAPGPAPKTYPASGPAGTEVELRLTAACPPSTRGVERGVDVDLIGPSGEVELAGAQGTEYTDDLQPFEVPLPYIGEELYEGYATGEPAFGEYRLRTRCVVYNDPSTSEYELVTRTFADVKFQLTGPTQTVALSPTSAKAGQLITLTPNQPCPRARSSWGVSVGADVHLENAVGSIQGWPTPSARADDSGYWALPITIPRDAKPARYIVHASCVNVNSQNDGASRLQYRPVFITVTP